jgi:hypothetical protein
MTAFHLRMTDRYIAESSLNKWTSASGTTLHLRSNVTGPVRRLTSREWLLYKVGA